MLRRLVPLLTFCCLLGATACTPERTGPIDTGCGSGGDEAYVVFNRVRSFFSRTMYISVCPTLDKGELDLSQALEVPGVSRMLVHNEKLFVFNGEAGTITRYSIGDDLILERDSIDGGDARLSLTDLGISSFTSANIVIDDTRAYYIDFFNGDQIVVWNPETMTLTSTFPLPNLHREGLDATVGTPLRVGDEVYLPIAFANADSTQIQESVEVLVLSATEDELLYALEDDRCVGASNLFYDDSDGNGHVYVVADSFAGLANLPRYGANVPGACALRIAPTSGAFDVEYHLDLDDALNGDAINAALGLGDGTFVTQTYTSSTNPDDLDIYAYFDGDFWRYASVSLDGEAVDIFDGSAPAPLSAPGWVINDELLVPQTNEADGSAALVRASDGDELLRVPGELFDVVRVR